MGLNIFGSLFSNGNGNGNGKHVLKKDCQEVHVRLEKYFDEKFSDTNTRITDLQRSIDNYINLLKNGR